MNHEAYYYPGHMLVFAVHILPVTRMPNHICDSRPIGYLLYSTPHSLHHRLDVAAHAAAAATGTSATVAAAASAPVSAGTTAEPSAPASAAVAAGTQGEFRLFCCLADSLLLLPLLMLLVLVLLLMLVVVAGSRL